VLSEHKSALLNDCDKNIWSFGKGRLRFIVKSMKLIIGLGNPGEKYADTRHNLGFMVLDELAEQQEHGGWKEKSKFKSLVIEHKTKTGDRLVLAKPQTYMNLSGEAVQALKQFYKLDNADITIVHDEVDLPFGEIKEKTSGGSAGHNGVQSIIDHVGDDFKRIRIGVRNEFTDKADTSQFVLSSFMEEEIALLPQVIEKTVSKFTF
jgi:PTH1 family peptidyl-tRNA hydrolase